MEKVLAVLATLVVGGLIAYQPPINAQLAKATSTLGAAFISLAVSAVVVGVLFLAAGKTGELRAVTEVPVHYLTGGLLGAALVTVSLVTVTTLGAGGVVAATVLSQLVVSALLDRVGALGLEQIPLSPWRLFGFALLATGTLVVVVAR